MTHTQQQQQHYLNAHWSQTDWGHRCHRCCHPKCFTAEPLAVLALMGIRPVTTTVRALHSSHGNSTEFTVVPHLKIPRAGTPPGRDWKVSLEWGRTHGQDLLQQRHGSQSDNVQVQMDQVMNSGTLKCHNIISRAKLSIPVAIVWAICCFF